MNTYIPVPSQHHPDLSDIGYVVDHGTRFRAHAKMYGQYVLADFDTVDEAVTALQANEDKGRENARKYNEARQKAIADGTFATGWAHAGCDHAYGICSSPGR